MRSQRLQPIGTPLNTGHTLARMIANGRLTIEALDDHEPRDWPPLVPYRNLARDWIKAHPDEWVAMQNPVATDNP